MSAAARAEDDAQCVVLQGVDLECARYYALKILNVDSARRFFAQLAKEISAPSKESSVQVSVAFTFGGLERLRVPKRVLESASSLSPEFAKGAAASATRVGDVASNAPAEWERSFTRQAHVLLSLYSDSDDRIEETLARWKNSSNGTVGGMINWEDPMLGRQLGKRNARIEPFGFRDGISQPTLHGIKTGVPDAVKARLHVKPGELLLGYENEDKANRWGEAAIGAEAFAFFRNGSFAAFRKMEQDVDRFNKLPLEQRAKMCGRWPNGAVVEPNQTEAPSPPSDLNDFDFKDDKSALGCPFASHIRRLNPRNEIVTPSRKRVLMRRGIPYEVSEGDKVKRGLLGLFFCADLEGQFEFLLGHWGRRPPIGNEEQPAADPIMGLQSNPESVFRIPSTPKNRDIHLNSFVATKGTMYVFYPSKTALGIIGSGT